MARRGRYGAEKRLKELKKKKKREEKLEKKRAKKIVNTEGEAETGGDEQPEKTDDAIEDGGETNKDDTP